MNQEACVVDQGEWERCHSTRRMFLALHDGGHQRSLGRVAQGLLRMADKRLSGHRKVQFAHRVWKDGLCDEHGKEQAERAYVVIVCVVEAINDSLVVKDTPRGLAQAATPGEVVVCSAIRSILPLAPNGFSQVGYQPTGACPIGDRHLPHRSLLDTARRTHE